MTIAHITSGNLNRTLVPVRGKEAVMMHLNSQHTITPNLPKPWTFLFSIKPNDPPRPTNNLILNFGARDNIMLSWSQNSLTYTISGQNPITIEIDTSKLNQFALEYIGKKLILWVNGISRKTHTDILLNNFLNVQIGVNFIGVVSIYSRNLSKQEIIEHFVEYHVKAFADDEVYY